jgi:hypothetical protein
LSCPDAPECRPAKTASLNECTERNVRKKKTATNWRSSARFTAVYITNGGNKDGHSIHDERGRLASDLRNGIRRKDHGAR